MLNGRSSENSETDESETSETQSPDNKRTKLNEGNNRSTTTHQHLDGGTIKNNFFHIITTEISVLYATPTLLALRLIVPRDIWIKAPIMTSGKLNFMRNFPFCFKTILLEMAGLKIVWWNSCGLCASTPSTPRKTGFFDKEFTNANFSVAAFVETRHSSEDDFPDLIQEYAHHNHVIHFPRPPEHSHTGIIVLINKIYDISQTQIIIPGRLINIRFLHHTTKHEYSMSVYYGFQLAHISKTKILETLQHFKGLHNLGDNNIMIGDFNFVENDIDKGKGMAAWDRTISTSWEELKSLANLHDPFRIQFPTKVAYTLVAPAGKSRIDRVYVNEENVQQVTQYKHLPTPFNLAHKVVSFTRNDQQERGQSYWKMNSSILQDRAYKIMIEKTFHNVNNLGITDKRTLWDVFLTCVRSKTVGYTKRKHFLTNSIRRRLHDDILKLEALPDDRMTTLQHRLATLKGSLRIYEESEIDGYRTRTRGLPKYETHEPNIEFFAKLEKRRAQHTVIGELQDKNGSLFSDRENLIRITTDFYNKTIHSISSEPQDTT